MGCITGHGYVDHVGACEYRSWEGGREAKDWAALFEDPFVHDLELLGCWRYELTGVCEARDWCVLEDIYLSKANYDGGEFHVGGL